MRAATNFATLRASTTMRRHASVSSNAARFLGNTLNRRTDSLSCRSDCTAVLRALIFLKVMTQNPKPHGDFQPPAATFPLRACGCGNFFEQKIQLAGWEQIKRRRKRSFARARWCDSARNAQDIHAQDRRVSVNDESFGPRENGPIGRGSIDRKNYFASLAI